MNDSHSEPTKTHQLEGWTRFLQELAPLDCLDEMPEPDAKWKAEKRKQLLTELYAVAEMEEQFKDGGMCESTPVRHDS